MTDIIDDIRNLTATDLKQKYQGEYQSWKNMKQRCKDPSSEWSYGPEFEHFDSFVSIVGPKPSPEHTLDRIDFTDPEYARGKVRWASKREQSENRASTVFISLDGHLRTLRGWAETTDQPYDTLRTRYNKDWPHFEVVFGRKAGISAQSGSTGSRQQRHQPNVTFQQAKKQLRNLLNKSSESIGEISSDANATELVQAAMREYKSLDDKVATYVGLLMELKLVAIEGTKLDEDWQWQADALNMKDYELLDSHRRYREKRAKLQKAIQSYAWVTEDDELRSFWADEAEDVELDD